MRLVTPLLVLVPSIAFANADRELEPPAPRMDRIEGPFPTANAYCAFRERQVGGDGDIAQRAAPCVDHALDDGATSSVPPQRTIRAYRVVDLVDGLHLVVETANGWYGRELMATANGDGANVVALRVGDLVGDAEDEIALDVRHSHAPCGCDDPWHAVTETFACTVLGGELRCTDGITTSDDMHLVDIWSWSSTLSISKDGRAKRTMIESEGVPERTLRALAAPFRIRFHR